MCRTSSRRSISLHPCRHGRCTNIVFQKSGVRMSRYLDTSTKRQMASIVVQYGRHSRPSRKESVRSPSGRTIMGKAIRESSIGTRLGNKFQSGNAYLSTEKKDYSCPCMRMTSNWLERNKILIRCGKYSTKKLIWENQHLSLIMFIWVALNESVNQEGIL